MTFLNSLFTNKRFAGSFFFFSKSQDVTDEKSFDSPYTKYSLYIDALHDAVSLLFVAYLVLQQQIPVEQMAEVLFEKLREQEIVFDFGETPNWIPVNKALCKVRLRHLLVLIK